MIKQRQPSTRCLKRGKEGLRTQVRFSEKNVSDMGSIMSFLKTLEYHGIPFLYYRRPKFESRWVIVCPRTDERQTYHRKSCSEVLDWYDGPDALPDWDQRVKDMFQHHGLETQRFFYKEHRMDPKERKRYLEGEWDTPAPGEF